MPENTPRPSRLPISHLQVASADGLVERHLVYCQRRSATVPVGRCRACRHFHAIQPGGDGGPATLVCDEAPADAEHDATLTLPRLSVGDLMTRDVLCVRPDLGLDTAALILIEHPHTLLPVVDEGGHVLGTVCDSDVQLEVQSGRSEVATVIDAMRPCVLTIPESTAITRAAAVMAFEGVSALVVVSPAGTVVGVLTAADLMFWLACADGYLPRHKRAAPRKVGAP